MKKSSIKVVIGSSGQKIVNRKWSIERKLIFEAEDVTDGFCMGYKDKSH